MWRKRLSYYKKRRKSSYSVVTEIGLQLVSSMSNLKFGQKIYMLARNLFQAMEVRRAFKNLPLTAWNMSTYKQIGDACGGLVEVSKSTMRKTYLIEVRLKIRHNYTRLILAQINITDNKNNIFTVQTISYTEGRWFKERNANIHGSFTRQAALKFNEFDFEAKQYSFMRFTATPPKKEEKKPKKTQKNSRNSNERPSISNSLDSTSKAIIISDNSDGGRGSDERLKSVISAKPLRIESPTFKDNSTCLDRTPMPLKISPKKGTYIHRKMKSPKMIYRVKNNHNKAIVLSAKQIVEAEKKEKTFNLIVDLGKKDINEEIFKKQLINWLKDNNLKLAPAFDNNVSSSKINLDNENNVGIDYEPLGSNSSP
ncbi:hypothetical protein E5676_scaffold4170G00120 [Cucumis melo var. makuwa]|uniref:Uncharacterized protein n=1 Tax=Cucumis melo var. makuwa TaxID=1194695 RepID=A0A5A7THF9_CUCMM|nr:hypothetical protein E6C27_scaffold529G00290 [Cucumis melo var. makuwa]TYK14278.1 hypothetical protein E5676_scaffold4170G00120 [Cucumis melo var. makuwa]